MTDIHETETTDIDQGVAATEPPEAATGRRSLLTKGVVAAAVGAVAGSALSKSASAANGDTMRTGETDSGTSTTTLQGGSTFRVINGNTSGSASVYGTQAGTANGDYGVHGRHTGSQGVGVYGEATGSGGFGAYGKSTGSDGTGVYGQHLGDTQSGTGVLGRSDRGTGVIGIGTTADLRANGVGRIGITPGAAITPTTAGGPGLLGRDDQGGLWYSPASGVWRKLADAVAAGAFHALAGARVFDSRFSTNFPAGSNRTVSIKDQINITTGAVSTTNIVPAGATAVTANVTVTNTVGGGFVAINPGGDDVVKASSVNWSANGQTLANAGVFALNSNRQIEVIAGGPAGSAADVLFDVTGYYL